MKYFLAYWFTFFLFTDLFAQDSSAHKRPKIGVTLSGGGAKGLAHIGILKALDSAGLKVDYITGTSMGSIIGAMYAVGYSADSIEKIARAIDWDLLLSNQLSLRNVTMEEKSEYDKYDIELPWVNNWFRISTGFLEGQELWLKFAGLFFPVYKIKDFNRFPIPFKCIATDVATGEAVVLDSGELITAVRASMAIPTIFTAVDFKGKKLVDGGVVRNFPVKDVKNMGADFVIGSNVTGDLLSSDKVNNAWQVLLQIAFFRESEDTRTEVPLCNIYIPFHLEKYSMGSFGETDKIIDIGIAEGRKLYPVFKRIADSLNNIYGQPLKRQQVIQEEKPVRITSVEVTGLQRTSEDFFLHSMDFYRNHYYSSENLLHMVRRAAGTRYYSRVNFSLQPLPDGSCKIIFDVSENVLTFAKIGLHYDQFNGIAAIFNLTSRDFLTPNSRSLVTVSVGDNFRFRAEHLQYLGRLSNFTFTPSMQFDNLSITTYTNYREAGLYTQNYLKFDGKFDYSTSRNITFGAGTRIEFISYTPSLTSSLEFQGDNRFGTSYLFFKHNTLDRAVFPRSGVKIDVEADYVYPQDPDVKIHLSSTNDSTFSSDRYQRFLFNEEGYIQLGRRSSIMANSQAGINFNYSNNIMNEFVIGGLINTFHNQITFAGLREGTIYSPSVAELQLGYRYQIFNNSFITAKANVLFNNFFTTSSFFNAPDFLSGYALTFSYNFALGPLEVSAMYCDQAHRVIGYVNIGIPF
jgi:NTE family protein